MIDWNVILSNVLEAVLILVLPAVAVAITRWLWAQASIIWHTIEQSRPGLADVLAQVSAFAVAAAEQAGIGGLIDDKKKYALEIAEKWLAENNITIDLELVSAAIEVAVSETTT
jgi:hypothetical protein